MIFVVFSYVAVVIDTDGSAFITKAEFDSLKNNFQAQIDNYNNGIDSKIDSAIANYLSGLSVVSEKTLYLDEKCGYVFPLRYETNVGNEAWNIPMGVWDSIAIPYFTKKTAIYWMYLGCVNKQTPTGWSWINFATSGSTAATGLFKAGAFDAATNPGTYSHPDSSIKFEINNTELSQQGFAGRNGRLNVVEATIEHLPAVGANNPWGITATSEPRIWNLVSQGIGMQKVFYKTSVSHNYMGYTDGHLGNKTSAQVFTYPRIAFCKMTNGSIVKLDGADAYWTKGHFMAWQWGHKGSAISNMYSAFDYDTGWRYGGNDVWWLCGSGTAGLRGVIGDNDIMLSNSITYSSTGTNFIFGHGAYMPANEKSSWRLTPDLIPGGWSSQTPPYNGLCLISGATPSYQNMWFWSLVSRTANTAPLVSTYPLWMTNLVCAGSPDVGWNIDSDFSMMPSSFVRYTDSNGKKHFCDEGMFLGNIGYKGTVSFNVKFQKDAGTGASLKLHLSKKPFSYKCASTDLIEYTVTDTGAPSAPATEQTLNYSHEYKITVKDIQNGDQLYMEWLPVTSGDLIAIESFSDYKAEVV